MAISSAVGDTRRSSLNSTGTDAEGALPAMRVAAFHGARTSAAQAADTIALSLGTASGALSAYATALEKAQQAIVDANFDWDDAHDQWLAAIHSVIPWSTIGPARVLVVRRLGWLGRRPEIPSSSPHHRFGFAGLHGLALNGLDTATHGWVQVPGLIEVQDPIRSGTRVSDPAAHGRRPGDRRRGTCWRG